MLLRRIATAIGLLCALIGSQLPEFAQQYRQRLGGALAELNRVVAQFDSEAAQESLSRAQALERLETNPDPLARGRGDAIAGDIARDDRLSRQWDALTHSGPLVRVAALIENFDPTTLADSIADFEPAIPVTSEAMVIGALALVIGWSATHLVAWPFRRRRRREEHPHLQSAQPSGARLGRER